MSNSTPSFALRRNRCWTTRALLPSWRGFQSRRGSYGSQGESRSSDGIVEIVFAPEGRGTEPLNDVEIASVVWVIDNNALISRALVGSLLKAYPGMQQQYGYSNREKAELMPDVTSLDDFRSLVGLSSVNVHQVQKDGMPYAGFEFGCTWDEEHGLGVLMHGRRTVAIGKADTALLLWIAEEDGGVPLMLGSKQ